MQYKSEKKYDYNTVPPDVREALDSLIEDEGLECTDNLRFSPDDDEEGMDEFDAIEAAGCCGSMNTKYTDITGRVWSVGCNFGH